MSTCDLQQTLMCDEVQINSDDKLMDSLGDDLLSTECDRFAEVMVIFFNYFGFKYPLNLSHSSPLSHSPLGGGAQ